MCCCLPCISTNRAALFLGYGTWDSGADRTIPPALFVSFRIYKRLLQRGLYIWVEVRYISRTNGQRLNPSIVPYHWRLSKDDMDPNPAFVDIYKTHFDALSPWTIGRYHMQDLDEGAVERELVDNLQYLSSGGPSYFPTIWPGESVCAHISCSEATISH